MTAEAPALARVKESNGLVAWIRGPWTIAVYTWRESMRKRTLVGFLLLSLLVIFGATFMTSFLDQQTVGEEAQDVDMKLIKDICITTISIFGMLITIFISAGAVPAEVENKVIYTVLSKPVRRIQYLLGKFIGVQMTVILNLALMGGLFFAALYIRQGIPPTLLLWAILMTYFEFLIISAFTFAVAATASSAVLPTIAGLFIYITGNLTEYLGDVAIRSEASEFWADKLVGTIASWLHMALPNLQNFSMRMELVNGLPNDVPNFAMIPNMIFYSLVYSAGGFALAYWVFRRKEM
jgi:ABC-type transport system involved in multi-copper enzyme maturation permease subunit